jgi:hypothetical protein
MDLEIRTFKLCPDGSYVPLLHKHVLIDESLESARRMAVQQFEALPEVDRAEVVNSLTGETLFVWPQEPGRA